MRTHRAPGVSVENRQLYAENRKLLQENGRLREELARLRPFSPRSGLRRRWMARRPGGVFHHPTVPAKLSPSGAVPAQRRRRRGLFPCPKAYGAFDLWSGQNHSSRRQATE